MSALRVPVADQPRLWPCLGMVEGELVDTSTGLPAPAVARLVHDGFAGHVNSGAFVCVGGKAAFSRETYRVGVMGELGTEESARGLAVGLTEFARQRQAADSDFYTYAAFFTGPVGQDEEAFETALWNQLQLLHELDDEPWDDEVSANPGDPHFSFSFGGHAYFIVGLHGASSRWSRRFAWPTLVFNPHEQFDELRDDGRMVRWQEVIRERDADLQGGINPNLGDFGMVPEARQYSGKHNPSDWRCPFNPASS